MELQENKVCGVRATVKETIEGQEAGHVGVCLVRFMKLSRFSAPSLLPRGVEGDFHTETLPIML